METANSISTLLDIYLLHFVVSHKSSSTNKYSYFTSSNE